MITWKMAVKAEKETDDYNYLVTPFMLGYWACVSESCALPASV